MTNYPFIIASFPDLRLTFLRHPLEADKAMAELREHLSGKDNHLVDLLERELTGEGLDEEFYQEVGRSRSRFLKEWTAFDRKFRLAKLSWLEGTAYEEDFDEYDKARRIFTIENILEREKALDRLSWDKAEEIAAFDVLTIDTILSLLVHLHIAARWNRLDPKTGAELFRKLVDEVKSTFQGFNSEQKQE